MRWLGRAFPILAAAMAVALTPASAIAATAPTYSDPITGFEYTAAATQGSFAGAAVVCPGPAPGRQRVGQHPAWHLRHDHRW